MTFSFSKFIQRSHCIGPTQIISIIQCIRIVVKHIFKTIYIRYYYWIAQVTSIPTTQIVMFRPSFMLITTQIYKTVFVINASPAINMVRCTGLDYYILPLLCCTIMFDIAAGYHKSKWEIDVLHSIIVCGRWYYTFHRSITKT